MIFLVIIILLLLVCVARLWAEKEHWLQMYIAERKKGNPDMWYSGKDGAWHEVFY